MTMQLFSSILLLFAGNELSVQAEPTEVWVNVNGDDNGFELFRKDTTQSKTIRDDSLFYTFYLAGKGCDASANFGVFIDDKPDGQKWHKVRYTLEFVRGGASCYSLFGDTHYGDFEVDTLGLTTLYVKENALTTGNYNGLPKRICNNEDSNFLHIKHGYQTNRGYMRVEQDRDLSVDRAGIGAGFACIEYGTMIILRDVQVAYWRIPPTVSRSYKTYSNKQCVGTGDDILRDFVGTTEECKAKCDELNCIGFVRVHSAGSGSSEFVGKCYFRGGEMNWPYAYTGDVRACYIPNTQDYVYDPLFHEALTLGTNAEDAFGETIDIGEEAFNEKFAISKVIKRECPTCADSHKLIFYRRLSDIGDFNAYANMKSWMSEGNDMENGDFALYSTLNDFIHDENRWTFCNYNDVGIGFPRGCGPTGLVPWQWTSATRGGKAAKFSVLDAELPDQELIEEFNLVDDDKNGWISFEEWIQTLVIDPKDFDNYLPQLREWWYEHMDANHDDQLSMGEVRDLN